MAIIKRGYKVYLIRVYVRRDPFTKRRIEINETYHGTLEGAQKREQVLKKQAHKGSNSMSAGMTLNQLIDSYLELSRHRLSQSSIYTLKRNLDLYVRPYIGSHKIAKITVSDIQNLLNFLLDPKKEKVNGGTKEAE